MGLLGSFIGNAAAGAGQAAEGIANDYIKSDNTLNVQSQLQAQAGAIQQARDQFVSNLQTQQYKDKSSFDNDPTQVAATAARTGAVTGAETAAKTANTPIKLTPGETLNNAATGAEIGSNDNPTMVDAYYEGVRQSAGANSQANTAARAAAAADLERQKEFAKINDPKLYTDPTTNALDTAKYAAVTALGGAQLRANPQATPEEAVAKAQDVYAQAQQAAMKIAPRDTNLIGMDKSTPRPDAVPALTRQIVGNILNGMPASKAFDPATYAPPGTTGAGVNNSNRAPAKSLFDRFFFMSPTETPEQRAARTTAVDPNVDDLRPAGL